MSALRLKKRVKVSPEKKAEAPIQRDAVTASRWGLGFLIFVTAYKLRHKCDHFHLYYHYYYYYYYYYHYYPGIL